MDTTKFRHTHLKNEGYINKDVVAINAKCLASITMDEILENVKAAKTAPTIKVVDYPDTLSCATGLSDEALERIWTEMTDLVKQYNIQCFCPECKSIRIDPCGRGGYRCGNCGHTFGAD